MHTHKHCKVWTGSLIPVNTIKSKNSRRSYYISNLIIWLTANCSHTCGCNLVTFRNKTACEQRIGRREYKHWIQIQHTIKTVTRFICDYTKMTNTTGTTNCAVSYLLISPPLFENNFLISIPISLIEIFSLFIPEYSPTAGIYNQSLCCLDVYNKHLDANIFALYKGLATSVRSNIINLQLSPASKWFPVTRICKHLYSNDSLFQARFSVDIFQQYGTENQSHGELNQKGNNWSINDQVTTRHRCPQIIPCFPCLGRSRDALFDSGPFFTNDLHYCCTFFDFAKAKLTDNYFSGEPAAQCRQTSLTADMGNICFMSQSKGSLKWAAVFSKKKKSIHIPCWKIILHLLSIQHNTPLCSITASCPKLIPQKSSNSYF